MYFCSVVYNDATSFYSDIMVATNLVWFNVWGGSSILSIQLALYFAFSILWFYAVRMSKRSTGAGGVSFGSVVTPSPRSFFILDI